MNIEVYSFSLVTTVLGMLVVFLALSALSVMMVVLKHVFKGEGKSSRDKRTGGAPTAKAGAVEQTVFAHQMPVWVPTAIAAYLSAEKEPDRPSADPWNAVVNHYDPWISANRPGKPGV